MHLLGGSWLCMVLCPLWSASRSSHPHMRHASASICALCLLLAACGRPLPEPAVENASAAVPRLSNTGQVPAPAPGALTRTTVHESARTVTQILRLAPGAEIAEHHHPFFDESLIVERGRVQVQLNGQTHELVAADVVVIPTGTVIAGRNSGTEEARAVVVFSNIGRVGPLTVPGHPQH